MHRTVAARAGGALARTGGVTLLLNVVLALLPVVPSAAGAQAAAGETSAVRLQLLASNDFHGRLEAAPALASAIGELRDAEPNTLFVGVGDLIGASTFDSFVAKDRPTIEVMNALGMEVSAVGNHEYDQGHHDLVERVSGAFDPVANPLGGAQWPYLAANLRRRDDGTPALRDPLRGRDGSTWLTEVDGITVGFVGVVTESLPLVVPPAGIAELEVTDLVQEANRGAAALVGAGADVVVALVHEGAGSTHASAMTDPSTAFGRIVTGLDPSIDVIFSGHTHLEYSHVVSGRPVLSGAAYGTHLSRVVLQIDPDTGRATTERAEVVPAAQVVGASSAATALRSQVQRIVTAAGVSAETLGGRTLGVLSSPVRRSVTATGVENRGAESALGNLVAEAQRWATSRSAGERTDVAFTNPGGLRADLLSPRVTYRDAAAVQPFANTLVTMTMTGRELKRALEQQWQRDEEGRELTARPLRMLGASGGFLFSYDARRPLDDRVTGIWVNGVRVLPQGRYRVATNSFLAGGGDGFTAFADAGPHHDTGENDLTGLVEYIARTGNDILQVPTEQRGVEVRRGSSTDLAPEVVAGETFRIEVASWSFSAAGSLRDERVELWLDGQKVAQGSLDHTVAPEPLDATGRAVLNVRLPVTSAPGRHVVELRGALTGTTVPVELMVRPAPVAQNSVAQNSAARLTVSGPSRVAAHRGRATWTVRVHGDGARHPSGRLLVLRDGVLHRKVPVVAGRAHVRLGALDAAGPARLTFRYTGDARHRAAVRSMRIRVVRHRPRISVGTVPVRSGRTVRIPVQIHAPSGAVDPTGTVRSIVRQNGLSVVRVHRLRAGAARVPVELDSAARATVTIRYGGNPRFAPTSRTVVLRRG